MIRLKHPQATSHAQNCAKPERPQITPASVKFRSAPAQISGQITRKLDRRRFNKGRVENLRPAPPWPKGVSANPGGRPRRVADAVNEELDRIVRVIVVDQAGKTHRIKMTRRQAMAMSIVDNACTTKPHSVGAFRTICELVEPIEEEASKSNDRDFTRLVTQLLWERKANERPI